MSAFDDRHLDDDTRTVLEACRLLDIREIDFFRLSWRRSVGGAPDERMIERAFANYMFGHGAPAWVRQTGREVVQRAAEDRLDPLDFSARRFQPHEAPIPRGHMIVAGFSIVALGFVALLTWHASNDRPGALRAQCRDANGGMGFIEKIAQLQTGKADPFNCSKFR